MERCVVKAETENRLKRYSAAGLGLASANSLATLRRSAELRPVFAACQVRIAFISQLFPIFSAEIHKLAADSASYCLCLPSLLALWRFSVC